MKYRGILYFFLMVFYSINAFGNDLTLPKPLNNNDEKLYRKVFELQSEGRFKEVEKLTVSFSFCSLNNFHLPNLCA